MPLPTQPSSRALPRAIFSSQLGSRLTSCLSSHSSHTCEQTEPKSQRHGTHSAAHRARSSRAAIQFFLDRGSGTLSCKPMGIAASSSTTTTTTSSQQPHQPAARQLRQNEPTHAL
mmetsp:Transcript_46652/g.104554  ORF Transcript_46652/g.104554 Transcript_46652/m.104554 type:complete len:115 (+) Transcript_46652:53-397(+)